MSTPKERPILMCAEMVRATLEDRKTQTRRIANPQPEMVVFENGSEPVPAFPRKLCAPGFEAIGVKVFNAGGNDGLVNCPYGRSGDRLWVKETFQFIQAKSDGQRGVFSSVVPFTQHDYRWIEFAATPRDEEPPKWKPSIFMPRWASRITLEIVSVRVERVQDISEADARCEGTASNVIDGMARADFVTLWESLNHKRGFGWANNPWVWRIEFRRLP